MNGEQVLALIRGVAVSEPDRAVRALIYIIDEELPKIRQHLRMHAGAPGDSRHIGYMAGEANTVGLIEEALFEVFQMWPVSSGPSLTGRLPAADAVVDLPRQVWAELLEALADDATGQQRAVARGRLLALARESWMQAPPGPR